MAVNLKNNSFVKKDSTNSTGLKIFHLNEKFTTNPVAGGNDVPGTGLRNDRVQSLAGIDF